MYEPEYAECYDVRDNVILIQSVLSEAEYEFIFPYRDASMTYEVFLKAASLFPMFCGERNVVNMNLFTDSTACKRELAFFFAHISYDSSSKDVSIAEQWRQGLQYMDDQTCQFEPSTNYLCAQADSFDPIWTPTAGKMYYGRGPIGIKKSKTYALFSRAWYQDRHDGQDVLLQSPESIKNDPIMLFASAFWRYMVPVKPAPSPHQVAAGFYMPNSYELANGILNAFGATTLALQGFDECG